MENANGSPRPQWADGVSALLADYDLFLIDQYGVVHDGKAIYAGAADAMRRLAAAGKHIVLMTNSGRSAAYNGARVERMGAPLDCVDEVVTSGDLAREWLREHHAGAACVALTSGGNAEDVTSAGLELVADVRHASLLFVSGLPLPAEELNEATYADLLDEAAAAGLPMICCNPDRCGVRGREVLPSPGSIAGWYEARDGAVRYFGKPMPGLFDKAMERFPGVPAARTIMLGDMPHTDLAGAANAGIDAALMLEGVHEMDTQGPDHATRLELACELMDNSHTSAGWVLPGLTW